jgi:hypothetical protein
MCYVAESDIKEILNVISRYVKANGVDGLQDYLADMKDQNKINYCGCDGLFETKIEGGDTMIYMEIFNKVYKFVVNENPAYSITSHAEAIGDGYDDFLEINGE